MTEQQVKTIAQIMAKLHLLGCPVKPSDKINVGPVVTVYRFVPAGSTKFSQIEALGQDLAITLGVENVLVKRLPGESAVAVFVPNPKDEIKFPDFKDTVSNCWQAHKREGNPTKVPLNFGVDYLGRPFVEDLSELPHLLIAGSTGAGKTTLLASIISSLIYVCPPDEVQLVLSDTKGVEFRRFAGVQNLMFEPAYTVLDTLQQMEWIIEDMDKRYNLFAQRNVRNITEYNKLPIKKLPFIVIVFDELADILTDTTKEENDEGKPTGPSRGRRCEQMLAKITQKARAVGTYVIAATQRPSVKVVDGNIKANFPARLTLRLPTGMDSRTVLGTEGAEHLLGQGDMLYLSPNRPGLSRLHAPYAKLVDIDMAVHMASQRV
jgi:S-DNA-T family DNA segregation ATPase FtsK/SpoIIIE